MYMTKKEEIQKKKEIFLKITDKKSNKKETSCRVPGIMIARFFQRIYQFRRSRWLPRYGPVIHDRGASLVKRTHEALVRFEHFLDQF